MADVAPVNSAHSHARKAAHETEKVHWDEAAEEHRSAAADFSRAAKTAGDSEASRVLRLLEAQHERLARIIKSQNTAQLNEAIAETAVTPSLESKQPVEDVATPATTPSGPAPPTKTSTTSAIAAARLNARTRDSSPAPSLARDIASRRGIRPPGQPHSPSALARSRQLSPESQRRTKAVAPRIPPSIMESSATLPPQQRRAKTEDDGFATFYSSLTTGTMSRLSSVLAYAGLPLTAEESQQPEPAPKEKILKDRNNRTVSAANEPDVKKYFSKAALTAIEDEHRQRGAHGQVFGPAESFYVVQKGGGTYSYADIARNQQLHNAAMEDEELFVDAQEGTHNRNSSQASNRAAFGKSRTAEELELENTTLKTTLEQLASRLSNFEAHAQDASFAALSHSMASLPSNVPHPYHHAQPPPSESAGPGLNDALERVRALEMQISSQTEQHAKLEALAQKQEKKIRMYHSKWEDVKKSAREKEKAKREKAAGEAGGKAGSEPAE
ncbi:hypothetical protein Q7P36_006740 [Cladosporium allicinum]